MKLSDWFQKHIKGYPILRNEVEGKFVIGTCRDCSWSKVLEDEPHLSECQKVCGIVMQLDYGCIHWEQKDE